MKDNYLSLGSHRTTIGRNLLKPKAPSEDRAYKKTPKGRASIGEQLNKIDMSPTQALLFIGSHKDNQRFETTKNLSGYIFTYVKV